MKYLIAGLGAVLVGVTLLPARAVAAVDVVSSGKRGIRNNNAGNLVITNIPWRGKIPIEKNTDGTYEQFEHYIYGIRAMFMDVRGDIEKDGLNTIEKLIYEYAPPHENNTESYIQHVSNATGRPRGAPILKGDYENLIKAIIKHENGVQPYSDSDIKQAMAMAQ